MLKINKFSSFLFSFLPIGISLSIYAAEPKTPPDAVSLLNIVLNNPTQTYQGQMMVSFWSENESRAEDVRIYFTPPNKYRFEFLSPDGTVDRVVMSNDSREQIQLMKNSRVANIYTTDNKPSLISPREEKDLLMANYRATVQETEKALDRPTWSVELTPIVTGKPHQLMKVDKETHVILEIKRYFPEGKTGSLTRFTQFEPKPFLDDHLFLSDSAFNADAIRKDGIDTPNSDNITGKTTNNIFLLPTKLYGGFSLESGDQFEVKGKLIKHLRYTDGLLPVSIFQTPLPVKAPKKSATTLEWSRPLQMGSSSAGNIYQWENNEEYFTLIGDLQQDLLRQIAGNIKFKTFQ